MTIREKAICECYTGICFCAGAERAEVYKYLNEKFGRPVFTHEMNDHEMIKEKVKDDFIKVCRGDFNK